MTGPSPDLHALVEGQRFDAPVLAFLAVAALALAGDGFDPAAIGYVGPGADARWALPPQAMVPAFSAGIVGVMVGGPLLGWLGDRFGRRRLILTGLFAIAVFTTAPIGVRSTGQLAALRLLTGLGLGGVIPNVGPLVAELSPARVRGRRLVIVTLGMPVGVAAPGGSRRRWSRASAGRR